MLTSRGRRNLVESHGRLRKFVREAVAAPLDQPESMMGFKHRLKQFNESVRRFSQQLIWDMEGYGIGNRHEFSFGATDVKLRMKICPDGFVRGYVSHEYPSSKADAEILNVLLAKYGLDDKETAPFWDR